MNQTELNKYKAMLEAKQAELSAGLRNREDIAIEKTPDAIDEVQLAGERELAIRNLDRESSLLRNVSGALGRIADGSYGICLHCEEEIKPKRLDAVPWTKYCIRCQEAADRHEFETEWRDDRRIAGQRSLTFQISPKGQGAREVLAPFVFLGNSGQGGQMPQPQALAGSWGLTQSDQELCFPISQANVWNSTEERPGPPCPSRYPAGGLQSHHSRPPRLGGGGAWAVDEVLFVLPRLFPHKPYDGASFADRVAMLQDALADEPRFSIATGSGGLFREIAAGCRGLTAPRRGSASSAGRDAAERIVNWDYSEPRAIHRMLGEFGLLVAAAAVTTWLRPNCATPSTPCP